MRVGEESAGSFPAVLIFADPEGSVVPISHDGTRIAFHAPFDGILNLLDRADRPIGAARPVTAVVIRARDGLELVSYLSRPRNAQPREPLPMVLLVHGRPGLAMYGLYADH